MNKLFRRIGMALVGMAMAVGVGVAIGSNKPIEAKATVAPITSFSSTSGSIDDNISYVSAKGDGTTAPAISGTTLRIYKPASGKSTGGFITVTAASGYKMSSVTFTNSDDKPGTVEYTVDGGSFSSDISLAKEASYSIDDISASSVSLYNCGSDRLSIAGISVTYAASSKTVTYDKNSDDAEGSMESSTGTSVTAAACGFTWTGHTFAGWNTKSGGNGTSYAVGDSVSDSCTLYAQWSINTYAVSGTITNGSLSSTSSIDYGGDLEIKLEPSAHCVLPDELESVTMGKTDITESVLYDKKDGSIYYSPVTDNITIKASCVALKQLAIDVTATNGSYSGDSVIYDTETATIAFAADPHYKLPTSSEAFTVTNASIKSYNSSNGELVIQNADKAKDAVTVSVSMVAKVDNEIDVTLTNLSADGENAESVEEGASVTLHFTANDGYALPDEDSDNFSVADAASYTWTKGTGTLQITGGTKGDISVTISGVAKSLSSNSLTLSSTSGTYTLGDAFVVPTVTAHFNTGDETATADYSCANLVDGIFIATGSQTVVFTYTYTHGNTTETATANYTATVNAKQLSSAQYRKVTSTAEITDGKYLIVYETDSVAFDGSIDSASYDVASNNISVTISNGTIASSDAVNASAFTWNSTAGTLKSEAGYYIGRTNSSNGINASDSTAYTNTLSISSGNVVITASNNYVLRYNAASGQDRFRYYSGDSVEAIQLYKYYPAVTKSVYRITAELKSGTYYQGSSVSANDFTVTAYYDDGSDPATVNSDITVTNGVLSNVGSNTVTLTYEGKSCNVPVTAVERTAKLTSLSWSQSGMTVFDGEALDFADLATVTAHYDDDSSASKSIGDCSVGLYSKVGDVYTKEADIIDGHQFDLDDENGWYLGIAYTENAVIARAYSSEPVTIVETLDDITGYSLHEKTATWTSTDSYATYDGGKGTHSDPLDVDFDENIHVLGGGSGTNARAWSDGVRFYKGSTITFTPSNGAMIKSIALNSSEKTCSVAAKENEGTYTITNPTTGAVTISGWTGSQTISSDIVVTYDISEENDNIANTNATVQKAVLDFVGTMNKDLEVCSSYSLTSDIWTTLSGKYTNAKNALSTNDEKTLFENMFKYATATERDAEGEADSGDTLQNALARYDYILKTYGTTTYGDFLGRVAAGTLSLSGNVSSFYGVSSGDKTMPLILAIIAGGALAAGGLFLFQRKRRNEE